MGVSQSIESVRAAATPGYKSKPPTPTTTATGVAGLGMADLLRTAVDPTYKPKNSPSASRGGASSQQIVAINARFCSPGSVTLHLREKFFSLSGDSFTIKDVNSGVVWFRVQGSAFSIREKKTLCDANNSPVANMKEVFFALMPSYHVYGGSSSAGSPLFEIHCKFTIFSTDLRVEFANRATGKRCKMGLDGDWKHRKATIWLEVNGSGQRETVGRVYRPLTAARNMVLGKQDYYLQISPNVDIALMTLICVVLDEKASD